MTWRPSCNFSAVIPIRTASASRIGDGRARGRPRARARARPARADERTALREAENRFSMFAMFCQAQEQFLNHVVIQCLLNLLGILQASNLSTFSSFFFLAPCSREKALIVETLTQATEQFIGKILVDELG